VWQKVKREAFQELFQASVRGSYNETLKDWREYLLEVEASHIALPRDAALRAYYGMMGHELSATTARASMQAFFIQKRQTILTHSKFCSVIMSYSCVKIYQNIPCFYLSKKFIKRKFS
jgi:hypothetical protein